MAALVALVLALALNAYVLMGGADFGGGMWDLFAGGPRKADQRALIAHTIAPIWEANHVWLILVIVVLFTAFPVAFAMLGIVLHIPLTLMLVGIVLRGSAFVFRSYGRRAHAARWGRVFAMASLITPVVLGTIVGALVSGAVGDAYDHLPQSTFYQSFVAPWLSPFPIAVGMLALAMCAFLAAVYLTVATHDTALREDFRRRAIGAAVAMFLTAFGALALAALGAPRIRAGLTLTAWAMPLHAGTGIAAVTAFWALWYRRWAIARIAAAAQVSLILWGWLFAQYPLVIPPELSIARAAAPRQTLALLLGALAAGALVLIPSLVYLFRTFAVTRANDVPRPSS